MITVLGQQRLQQPDAVELVLGQHMLVSRPGRQPAIGPPGSYPDRTSTGRLRRAYEHEDPPCHYATVSPPALLGRTEDPG
jgi:hypothetical protein